MGFANTNKELTIIYHSDNHIGQQILALAQAEKLPIHDIDLAHMKLTGEHWAELASKLKIEIKDLINRENPDFMQKFSGSADLSEQDWLTLLIHNPNILKAPIVMKGDKIMMMTNSQEMLQFVK